MSVCFCHLDCSLLSLIVDGVGCLSPGDCSTTSSDDDDSSFEFDVDAIFLFLLEDIANHYWQLR